MSATIVFRGLLVFNHMGEDMEIGVVNAAAHTGGESHASHVPRIIKTKNGVISSIFDLRNRRELGPLTEPDSIRDWEIEVSNPIQPTATIFRQGDEFDRISHPFARDFRWLADLEGRDLHNRDLTSELNTAGLLMVLRIRHGQFYTHQLSKKLTRRNANPPARPREFGRAAEVIGCNIAFEMGTLELKAGDRLVYTFDEGDEDGVIYEFSNAPPDVPAMRPPYQPGPGHFAMYYTHLFSARPQDEFQLIPDGDPAPSPDPALCGAVGVGSRDGGL